MSLHFATLFDINYLTRGLVLYKSLEEHCKRRFTFYVLALDYEVVNYFKVNYYHNIEVVTINEILDFFSDLEIAKKNRDYSAFIFTLSPYWPLYLLRKKEINIITTIDADVCFFQSPEMIFEQYKDFDVLITPHNFSDNIKELELYGLYNVSFQSFRNSENGLKCLEGWRKDCFNWCNDFFDTENDRFADQKYLNSWEIKYDGVRVINLNGTGAAPWNIEKLNLNKRKKNFCVEGGAPLIFFHFHHLRLFGNFFANPNLGKYSVNKINSATRECYKKYILKIRTFEKKFLLDSKIQRNGTPANVSILHKLIYTQGYFLVTNIFIIYINIYKILYRIKTFFKFRWLH